MSRLAYFARETFISLRRNLLMTIAGIITVLISLFLFGGILLVQTTVDHGTDQWKHGVELEIFMKVDAPQSEVDAMRGQLDADKPRSRATASSTTTTRTTSSRRSSRTSRRWSRATTPDDLPESFRVVPVTAELTQQVADEVHRTRRASTRSSPPQEQIKRLLTATRWIRLVFIAMAARAARVVAVPDRQHDPARDLRRAGARSR